MAPAESIEALFKGRQLDQEIIVLCVRWLWVIRTLSALGIKDFRGVLLGMLRGVTAPPIDYAEAV